MISNPSPQLIRSLVSVAGNVTLTAYALHLVNTSAARTLTVPAVSSRVYFWIKDISGLAETNPITVVRAGAEKIENVAASMLLKANYGAWTFVSDGTDWWLL